MIKNCEECGVSLTRRDDESPQNFKKRKFCSGSCSNKNTEKSAYAPTEEELYGPGGLTHQIRANRRYGSPEDREPAPYTIQQCDSTIRRVVRKRIGAA